MIEGQDPEAVSSTDIAIIGMAAHLPGSDTVDAYWQNLRDGVESIRHLTREKLLAAGEAAHLIDRPDYVPACATLDRFADFDAEFFGFSPKEAAIMDPQHRQFLEVAWEALENAAHPPEHFPGPVGVFAGCGMGSYFYFNICSNRDLVDGTGMFLLRHTGNDKDFLSTRLSHILDLTGPSVNVQTACSTSLVAIHYAAQSLLNGECDMAIAGGVTIELPQLRGYLFKEGEILSPDGHCHAFDHRAQGTVFGSGAGAVVLRRLKDALEDGDHIWAVIKGTAVNNDGAAKAGYLAPSVDGQAAAIAEAQAVAGVSADTVDYIECHGTGTYLGDPIEVAALTEAFRKTTDRSDFCRIGSVKTNIGHLDTAAGVASLIKASLALHHRQMPPSLGFEKPNPAIGFDGSPFRVNDRLTDWPQRPHPPRAGVNSLGVGGTNAHAVLEAAPARAASDESDWPFQILPLSARSRAALDDASARLAAHLTANPDQPLADVAYTLKVGRRAFDRRRVIVAETHEEAARLLTENDPRRVFTHSVVADDPGVVFMFPGGGAQYAGMARDLYETEPVFRDWMDRGLAVLEPRLDYDIRALWLGEDPEAEARLRQPSVQLPLIMIVEYALAQLWMAWGVTPAALIGHSMGENTAACVAGVMGFEDCIGLVHLRGKLFDTVAPGGMLSVALPAEALRAYLGDDLDLAAVNAPNLSVATGPNAALDALQARLTAEEIDCQRIPIDIAAHSRMLETILGDFGAYLRSIKLNPPQIPFISNRTGAFITDEQATDPDYWVAHLRNTVHFADGLTTLSADPARVYIEVGPGKALSSLAGQHGTITANQVIGSLRHPQDEIADDKYFLAMLGRLWATGGRFDWSQIWGEARRNRVPLPTYPFQRQTYFIEPGKAAVEEQAQWLMREDDPAQWGYRPAWTPAYAPCDVDVTGDLTDAERQVWAIFEDDAGIAARVAARLRGAGHVVTTIRPGDTFARLDDDRLVIAPERGRESYDLLLRDLAQRGRTPTRILHLWLVTADERHRPGSSFFHRTQEQGFWSLFYLAQAMAEEGTPPPHLTVITSDAMQVRTEALRYPDKATVMGPARVIPREFPGVTCAVLDLTLAAKADPEPMARAVLEEVLAPPANTVAALRDRRYALSWRAAPLADAALPVTDGTPVLITGGFGGIGQTVAEALIRRHGCPIVLVSRSPLPPREDWPAHIRRSADATARRIRAVQRLEQAGGTVLTLTADVSNVEEMRAALAEAEAALGPIKGLVHAAGVIDDAPILSKSVMGIEDVFTPKIHGTQVLDGLFPDGRLDWMALFSSTSTVTAPAGQVDYVAANEYLNAFAKARADGKTRVVAIDWGIWSGVGMAAEAMEARTGRTPPPSEPVDQPLIDAAGFDGEGNRLLTATWTPATRWMLDEHRTLRGDALLPGTGYLELVAEALAVQGEDGPFEIADLNFLRPLRTPDGEDTQVRITLPRSETGYGFRVESATQGTGFDLNAEGEVRLLPLSPPPPLDLAAIAARLPEPERGTLRSPQEAHLKFGPRWRTLTETATGTDEGLARLRLPPKGAEGTSLHPGLMDLATGWAMGLIAGYTPSHLWAPVSYASVRVFGPLTEDVISWVRNASPNRAEGQTATFDITLAAPDGRVLVEVTGFTIRRLDGALSFGAAPPAKPTGPRPLSPAEERLRHNLTQGIRPEEGADAFFRALGAGQPQVIVSSLPLDGLIAQAGTETDDASRTQSFDRPQMEADYVEPEGEIETRLAAFWQDLLGVSKVGANDSFFDLGGHSLIAVRLFAMVKKTFQVDFPISILFEAPTIRACAALIAEQGVVPGKADSPTAPARAQRRFTHLVPMHQGEGGPKTPFFLVAGMFGNVLNLRHLAHLLGTDRPFFGLQARGLYGDADPHRDLTEAAADYLAEVRQVQPHGPYLLGGFSGGGITAYDMAHQLRAMGEEVAAVILLDTPLPQRRPLTRADRAAIQWHEIRAKGPAYPLIWARNRIAWEKSKRRKRAPEALETPQFQDTAIEAAFHEAIARYQVRPWDGPLTLFRPPLVGKWEVAPGRWISSERAYVLPDNDWTQYAPALEVFEVPGDHDSMVLEPNVRVLAARMKRVIEAAERARPERQAAE
ncbi:MAG: SDR family NAD(P)-dependent oxidoreductase [Rubellimicrobium sp.]|nr:SDR family NAD(P)-dependent oxidoreductase [Rubellimicrobium sp.]